jgi:3-oxoacyl-[acyl-carrier protein] reductase
MAEAAKSWVIVSGAGGALGSVLAHRYAEAGRTVLALDQDATRLETLGGIPGLMTATADLADPAALESALDAALPRREAIGLLVNAVGLIWNEPVLAVRGARFTAHAIGSFECVIRANLTAAFVTATRVAARMARTGRGVIVNFSSISAGGNTGQAAYSAAKAGIEGMTRAMAQELGPLGVRVNAIAPGFIDVATTRGAVAEPVLSEYSRHTPIGRIGTVEELAQAIDCLEANKFLNGVILPFDGGLRI